MTPSRREFLGAAAAAAGLAALGCANALPAQEERIRPFRLTLGEWSLHRRIRARELDPLDFPAFARDRFGLEGVDHVNQFFSDRAGDDAYFRELRRRTDDAGVRSVVLLCDEELALGDPDPAKRMLAVDRHRQWLDAAAILGCRAIRVNAYSEGSADEQMRLCAEGLHRLCDVAPPGLLVFVENHGGLSSRGDWLAALLDAVGHPAIGSLPDFGNWQYAPGQWYDRYAGVRELMPRADVVSAKAHDFDANGEETSTDFGRMLDVVATAGDVEWIEVEYEGDRLSEVDGIAATIELIHRHLQ
ncbi:MAG TPA: TIM barrel protein [Longimicrobiales bacterium]